MLFFQGIPALAYADFQFAGMTGLLLLFRLNIRQSFSFLMQKYYLCTQKKT
jgi:hypothetical protein